MQKGRRTGGRTDRHDKAKGRFSPYYEDTKNKRKAENPTILKGNLWKIWFYLGHSVRKDLRNKSYLWLFRGMLHNYICLMLTWIIFTESAYF